MFQYFCDYAHHFGLDNYVRLGHKVLNITRTPNHDQDGTWEVEFKDALVSLTGSGEKNTFRNGNVRVEQFDGVLVCTGHHAKPQWPNKWPGQDNFKGKIIHSHDYKEPKGYEDKVVVAVGIGNSGGDVAVELSHVAYQVYLSTRRGSWICSRLYDNGAPIDASTVGISTRRGGQGV